MDHHALPTPVPMVRRHGLAIVAIPANNEAAAIGRCLAALATQRDRCGAPLGPGDLEVIVFANTCTDRTVEVARAMAAESPHPIAVVEEILPADRRNAGWARKRAMDLAAERLRDLGRPDGLILTTDADSMAGPTWIDATLQAFEQGADAVAGYIDADPAEMMALGRDFVARGRLEERYMSAMAQICAICDPRPHDPWPNHRVSAGPSLAVRAAVYDAIGGLPVKAIGEDAALVRRLDDAGYKVRHAMDVCVTTSCRLDGRVEGGAAATMRHRHAHPDAPCDEDFEPALAAVRRALHKGRLRRLHEAGGLDACAWAARLGLEPRQALGLIEAQSRAGFETFWLTLEEASPVLRCRTRLRPSDLPRELRRAALCIGALLGAQDDRRSSR